MRTIAGTLRTWLATGQSVALATVVRTSDSAPHALGAAMAVNGSGAIAGSVSAGCVESAVVDAAQRVLRTGTPQLLSYGISSAEAVAVGPTCGGAIDVFVRPLARDRAVADVLDALQMRSSVALATVLDGAGCGRMLSVRSHEQVGSLGDELLDAAVADDARRLVAPGTSARRNYDTLQGADSTTVFVESFVCPPRMIVFGAGDYAGATSRIGSFLGYTVTVCDARSAFVTRDRFPAADEIVVAWPHRYLEQTAVDERTVLCVLTHDPKFDVPLLEAGLRTPAAFIGVLGSRTTHAGRIAELRQRGVAEHSLRRLRAPVGLDLGGQTAEETAVAIAAEIIAARSSAGARPLTDLSGPIHAVRTAAHAGS